MRGCLCADARRLHADLSRSGPRLRTVSETVWCDNRRESDFRYSARSTGRYCSPDQFPSRLARRSDRVPRQTEASSGSACSAGSACTADSGEETESMCVLGSDFLWAAPCAAASSSGLSSACRRLQPCGPAPSPEACGASALSLPSAARRAASAAAARAATSRAAAACWACSCRCFSSCSANSFC